MKLCEVLTAVQHSPVLLIAALDLVFLVLLFIVFHGDFPADLRTVIKDAFIGWNGALGLAINVSVKREQPLCTPESRTTPTGN